MRYFSFSFVLKTAESRANVWAVKLINLSPHPPLVTRLLSVMVLLLLLHCLLLFLVALYFVFGPCFVMQYLVLANNLKVLK